MSAALLPFRRADVDPRYQVGARVSYWDMANPRRVFVIVEPRSSRGYHRVVTEDGAQESQLHHRGLDSPGGWEHEPGIVNPAAVAYLVRTADANRARRIVEQREALEAHQRHATEGAAFLAEHRPTWAKALIIAELHQDDSDSMTDYFAHRTTRLLVLAWSRHTRDLFPELRKAAAIAAETAELAAAPASAEHREKYSMGGGYYLKAGDRHGNGWAVRKVPASDFWLRDVAVTIARDPAAYRVGAVPQ